MADLLTRRMQDRWRKTEARAYDVMVAYALVSAVLCFTVSEMAAGLVAALFTYVVFALRGARYPPYRERWSALGRCRERARE